MAEQLTVVYICQKCFSTAAAPGDCPTCRQARVECDPGDPDNPCRKPPMDADGRILSRAPLWWLARSVPHLRERVKAYMNRK